MTTKKEINGVTLVKAIGLMFKDMKSGKSVYLVFSKNSFRMLIFTMAMSIIANFVLVDLLISAPITIQRVFPISIIQFIISICAMISGLWLFLKGINIATDDIK